MVVQLTRVLLIGFCKPTIAVASFKFILTTPTYNQKQTQSSVGLAALSIPSGLIHLARLWSIKHGLPAFLPDYPSFSNGQLTKSP